MPNEHDDIRAVINEEMDEVLAAVRAKDFIKATRLLEDAIRKLSAIAGGEDTNYPNESADG